MPPTNPSYIPTQIPLIANLTSPIPSLNSSIPLGLNGKQQAPISAIDENGQPAWVQTMMWVLVGLKCVLLVLRIYFDRKHSMEKREKEEMMKKKGRGWDWFGRKGKGKRGDTDAERGVVVRVETTKKLQKLREIEDAEKVDLEKNC